MTENFTRARIGSVTFPKRFGRPNVSSSGEAKQTALEPIDTKPVVQSLGPGQRTYTIEGQCSPHQATALEALQGTKSTIRTNRTGVFRAAIKSVDIGSTKVPYHNQGDSDGPSEGYVHDFTVEALFLERGRRQGQNNQQDNAPNTPQGVR